MLFRKRNRRLKIISNEADEAERQGNYERVAELRYGKMKEAEKEIEQS